MNLPKTKPSVLILGPGIWYYMIHDAIHPFLSLQVGRILKNILSNGHLSETILKSDKHRVSEKEYNIISLMKMSLMSELTNDSKPSVLILGPGIWYYMIHDALHSFLSLQVGRILENILSNGHLSETIEIR